MDKALYGLFGVVLGSVLTILREYWNDYRSKKKKAIYLAIRVSSALDRFAEKCANVVQDNGLYQGQPNQDGNCEIQIEAPSIQLENIDVDWQSLQSSLMYDILNFPGLVDEKKHLIDGAFENSFPPDYDEGFEERQLQFAEIGLSAYDLSKQLRIKYKLPSVVHNDWDPIEYMSNRKEEILKCRNKRLESYNKIIKTIN